MKVVIRIYFGAPKGVFGHKLHSASAVVCFFLFFLFFFFSLSLSFSSLCYFFPLLLVFYFSSIFLSFFLSFNLYVISLLTYKFSPLKISSSCSVFFVCSFPSLSHVSFSIIPITPSSICSLMSPSLPPSIPTPSSHFSPHHHPPRLPLIPPP